MVFPVKGISHGKRLVVKKWVPSHVGSHRQQSAAAPESLVRALVPLSQLLPEPTRGTYPLVLGWLAEGAQQLQERQEEEEEWKAVGCLVNGNLLLWVQELWGRKVGTLEAAL